MVAYFKKLNNLYMLAGAAVGALAGLLIFRGQILLAGSPVRVFVFGMMIIAGVLVGRTCAMRAAGKKLQAVYDILYRETDPARFIETFTPMLAAVPENLAEYADGCCRISFAYEAMGDFAKAEETLQDLEPQKLALHALPATALIVNQRCNLRVLQKDREGALALVEDLKTLSGTAAKRAPTLQKNLEECVRLHTVRLDAQEGDPGTDTAYLEEEIRLSQNRIHQKEIQLELAQFYLLTGEEDKAGCLLEEIVKEPCGIFAEKAAEKLIKTV